MGGIRFHRATCSRAVPYPPSRSAATGVAVAMTALGEGHPRPVQTVLPAAQARPGSTNVLDEDEPPPGARTRRISANVAARSATEHRTSVLTTVSTAPESTGR